MSFKLFKKKERPKESVLEFIFTIISCWFMAVAAALIQDAQFTYQLGLVPILWQTLVAVVAVALLTRRWWISIVYFGILVPLFFLVVSLTGDIFSFFESFGSFLEWWLGGMKIGSNWYSNEGFYLIHTIINIGLGILFFAVARIFKKAWAPVLTALVLIALNYAYGYTGYNILAVPFYIVGIFPLIAGDRFQNIKLPNMRNLFGVMGKKWMLMMVSTFIAVLISLLSLTVINSTKGSVRNRFSSDIVADAQTASNLYTNEESNLDISLFDLGLVVNSTYIGGDLYDIKPKTLATTNLAQQTLIKVTSYENFNGLMWESDFYKTYRVDGSWDEEKGIYLSTRLQDNKMFMHELGNAGYRVKVKITLTRKANFLPSVGKVMNYEELTRTKNPILFDFQGRLLSFYGQPKEYSYALDTIIFNTTDEVSVMQMNNILGMYDFEDDPQYNKNSEFYNIYTKRLGESEYVTKTLKQLNFTTENEYEKAYAICQYFSEKNGFVYAEKPPTFVKGDNIVNKLFQTRSGHCMYYATAMIAMCREAGIPARLAAGYLTVPSNDGVTQKIDASSPYAWVECYMPNVGWLPFNPTPDASARPVGTGGGNGNNDGETPSITVDEEREQEDLTVAGTHLKWDTMVNVPLIIGLSLLALFIIALVINIFNSQKCYELIRVRKRYKTVEKQAEFYYLDILRQYMWLGFRLKKGETLQEITQRVSASLSEDYAEKLALAVEIMEAYLYGNQIPTDEDIEVIYKARRVVENTLKDKNNGFMYVIKRRLLLPPFIVRPKLPKQLMK